MAIRHQRVAALSLGCLLAVGLVGCSTSDPGDQPSEQASSSASTPPASVPASGLSPTPSPMSTPKAAVTALLPDQLDGWTAQSSPSALPTTIDNIQVVMQSGLYTSNGDTRIVTLITTDDRGYAESQARELSSAGYYERAVCGFPQDVPHAVSCIIELDGGLIQTTATGNDAVALGQFTNDLYGSFS